MGLVSREVFPFGGGGIGEYVTSCARLLATFCEVAIFTTSAHRQSYRRARAAGDPRMPPGDIEVVFVAEPRPEDVGSFFSFMHVYSARARDALHSYYGEAGPDLIEFSDYLGEGAVTVQARRGGEPWLRNTKVGVRLHTTAELCALLNGHVGTEAEARMTCELERLALRDADVLLWPGGDTLASYHRFYGADAVAPGRLIRNPFLDPGDARRRDVPRSRNDPLRLLYLGRLERRKGVQNLVNAVSAIDSNFVQLTLLGGDTDTAPLGTSMLAQIELTAAGDPRIELSPPVPRADLATTIRNSDAVVLPSLWEAWPYVGLEALRLNRPLIATPVGGFTELVRPGAAGWLTEDARTESLAKLIERLLFSRDEVEHLRLEGLPASVFAEMTDAECICESYRELLESPGRWDVGERGRGAVHAAGTATRRRPPAVASARPPLASIVIPYYRLDAHIEETVVSAIEQTYSRTEVIVVNDGSFSDPDWILAELAARYPIHVLTQVNSGLGAARNFGITQSRGSYVVPLDADNVLEPAFVERSVQLLEGDPDLAFVTSWTRYIDERGRPLETPNVGYQPLGNRAEGVVTDNLAGDAIAVFRRWLFDRDFQYSQDLTSYEDWDLYRQLHEAAHFGTVIAERLIRYRVRGDSMIRQIGFPHTGRLAGEMTAHSINRRLGWMSRSD